MWYNYNLLQKKMICGPMVCAYLPQRRPKKSMVELEIFLTYFTDKPGGELV